MPLLNFGVIPAAGAGGTELQNTTRRAVMPAVVVQIGKSTVLLSSMLAGAEPVVGGVSPVTIPIQGSRMVAGAWADYSGAFGAPALLPGLQNAEYNLAAFVVGIPYYLFEGFVQQDAELVPIIWARMNDAGNYTSDQLALALWAALGANTTLMPFSINDIIAATDPTQGALGNLPVATNTFWVANSQSIAVINTGSAAWSRVNVLGAITYAQKGSGGEPPSCVIVSPGAWMAIAGDAIGNERYLVDKEGTYADAAEGATVGFPAINVGGVPVYADLYQTVNTEALLPNFNYLSAKIHQEAAFAVAGPESLLPQFQLGYVMALFVLLSFVCSKRNAQSKVTAFTGAFAI
jgi:hypothetical protein